MRKSLNIIVLSVILSAITACATVAEGPAYAVAKARENKDGHATLYVYREYAEPTAWGVTINIDGKQVSTLNQGGFTWVYIKPGTREVTGVWAAMAGQKESSITLEAAAGKTYFLDLTGKVRLSGMSSGTMYWNVGSGLNAVNPDVAQNKLEKCCKFQKAATDTY